MIFEKSGVRHFEGTYEEYEAERQEEIVEKIVEKKEKIQNNTYLQKKQQARNEAKMKKLEKEIEVLEQKLSELNLELQKEENYSDYEKLMNIQNEIAKINEEIESKMQEWEELGS